MTICIMQAIQEEWCSMPGLPERARKLLALATVPNYGQLALLST
jgi:hypothetical protein